jgi:hypothetical protein
MLNDTWKMIISLFLGGNTLFWFINEIWIFAFVSIMLLIICEYIWIEQEKMLHFGLSSNKG